MIGIGDSRFIIIFKVCVSEWNFIGVLKAYIIMAEDDLRPGSIGIERIVSVEVETHCWKKGGLKSISASAYL